MSNYITIFFSGKIKDINGNFSRKDFKVIAKPNETVKELISRFYQLVGLSLHFRSEFYDKNLEN